MQIRVLPHRLVLLNGVWLVAYGDRCSVFVYSCLLREMQLKHNINLAVPLGVYVCDRV